MWGLGLGGSCFNGCLRLVWDIAGVGWVGLFSLVFCGILMGFLVDI